MPDDLKHFNAADNDGFQLLTPENAGWVILAAFLVLVLCDARGLL